MDDHDERRWKTHIDDMMEPIVVCVSEVHANWLESEPKTVVPFSDAVGSSQMDRAPRTEGGVGITRGTTGCVLGNVFSYNMI